MKATSSNVDVNWMVYPDKRHQPIPQFYKAKEGGIIYEMAGHYYVRTVYGVVAFTENDVLLFNRDFGVLPLRKTIFEKLFVKEEEK